MQIRVITMRYSEGLQGFPEDALRTATFGRDVLSMEHHFFVHGNMPHITLVLSLADSGSGDPGKNGMSYEERKAKAEAEEAQLPEVSRPAFRALKDWRNQLAKAKGCPAYNIARNAQLLEIVKKKPKTLAELKEVAGCTEKFCKLYGEEILKMMAQAPHAGVPASQAVSPEDDEEKEKAAGRDNLQIEEQEMPF